MTAPPVDWVEAAEAADPASLADQAAVAALLGREPQGDFEVVVRRTGGAPVVIENAPVLPGGRPMPTRWWLVDTELCRRVGTLEAEGGVRRAEAEVGEAVMADAHRRYEMLRDGAMPQDHHGPRPTGGVGGTRRGGKCLHAHLAWWLAGGDDPTGAWVATRLVERGQAPDLRRGDEPVRWPEAGDGSGGGDGSADSDLSDGGDENDDIEGCDP